MLLKPETGSNSKKKYMICTQAPKEKTNTLRALVNEQKSIPIEDAEDYGAYHRSFLIISNFLASKSRLSNREISHYFLQGLEQSFRYKVEAQLKAEYPKRHPEDSYTLQEIKSAALFYLSCFPEIQQKAPPISSISNKNEDLHQSHKKHKLIIEAVVEAITKNRPKMELQQKRGLQRNTGRKEDNRIKRMNEQQDIRSKKESEVSDLKKSDSNTISEPYRYITPIDNSTSAHQSSVITPIASRVRETVQPKILAIKSQDLLHDSKPSQVTRENVLVLENSIQQPTKDYSTGHLQPSEAPQKDDHTPAGKIPDSPSEADSRLVTPDRTTTISVTFRVPENEDIKPKPIGQENILVFTNSIQDAREDNDTLQFSHAPQAVKHSAEVLPIEAASPLVTAAQPTTKSPVVAEFPCTPDLLSTPEIPRRAIPRTMIYQEWKYLSSDKEARFLWPEKDNPATRLIGERFDSQSASSMKDKKLLYKFLNPKNVSMNGNKSNTREFSVALANLSRLDKITRGRLYLEMHLRTQNGCAICLRSIIVESTLTIKQCAQTLISKKPDQSISRSSQKNLVYQVQDLMNPRVQPLSSRPIKVARRHPNPTIIPENFRNRKTLQPKISCIEIMDLLQDSSLDPISQENILLINDIQVQYTNDYDTSLFPLTRTQELHTPSAIMPHLPSTAASPPSSLISTSTAEFVHLPNVPWNSEMPQEGTTSD